jgi:hypothetical protein
LPLGVARYGYDVKYASHALRLAYQGLEITREGRLTLPMPEPERERVLWVKRGDVPTMDEVLDGIDNVQARIQGVLIDGRGPLPARTGLGHHLRLVGAGAPPALELDLTRLGSGRPFGLTMMKLPVVYRYRSTSRLSGERFLPWGRAYIASTDCSAQRIRGTAVSGWSPYSPATSIAQPRLPPWARTARRMASVTSARLS